MHKLIARLLISFLSVWFVCQPGIATAGAITTFRVGSTFYPVTAQGALGAATDVALLAGRASPWIAGLSLGYQIGKFALEGLDSNGVVVPLNVQPANVAQAPSSSASWSGWTYDTVTRTWRPPVSQMASSVVEYAGGSPLGWSPEMASAGAAECAYSGAGNGVPYFHHGSLSQIAGQWHVYCQNATGTVVLLQSINAWRTTYSCVSGYTFNGSNGCDLTNESLVKYPSDNAPTVIVKPDGSGFALDPRDPDNAKAPVNIPSAWQIPGTVSGQNTRVTIEPQTGGGLKVTTEQEVISSDGSKITFKQRVLVDAGGKVVTSDSGNYPGGLPEQTPQTTALTPSTSPSLDLPTDYNREATQLAIKDEIAAQGETNALDVSSDTASAQIKQHYDNRVDAGKINDIMAGVGLPSLPGFLFPTITAPACRPIGWVFQGHEVSYDLCPYVPTIKSIAGWVLNLIAAALAFQMLMNFRAMRVRG